MAGDAMQCVEAAELATEYMEGALAWPQRAALRWHLRVCGMCRNYLDQLGKSVRLVQGQAMEAPSEEVEARLAEGRQ